MTQVRNMKQPAIDKWARKKQIKKVLAQRQRRWRAAHAYLLSLDYEIAELKKEYEKLERETFVKPEKERKKKSSGLKGVPREVLDILKMRKEK